MDQETREKVMREHKRNLLELEEGYVYRISLDKFSISPCLSLTFYRSSFSLSLTYYHRDYIISGMALLFKITCR